MHDILETIQQILIDKGYFAKQVIIDGFIMIFDVYAGINEVIDISRREQQDILDELTALQARFTALPELRSGHA